MTSTSGRTTAGPSTPTRRWVRGCAGCLLLSTQCAQGLTDTSHGPDHPHRQPQAIALAPEEASYYSNRAAAAMMLLQYEQAAEDCDRAIRLTPDNPKLYFRKGKALASLVRLTETNGPD